jgi:hypothetical protein
VPHAHPEPWSGRDGDRESVQVHSPSHLLCAYIRGLPPLAQTHILTPRYYCLGDLSLLPLCCYFLPFPTQALRAHCLREQLPPNLVCLVILLGIGTPRCSCLGDLSLLPLCCCFLPFPTQALRAHCLREQLPPNLVYLVILLGIGGR